MMPAARPATTAAISATTRGPVRAGAQLPVTTTATPTVPKNTSRYANSHANTLAPSGSVLPGISVLAIA